MTCPECEKFSALLANQDRGLDAMRAFVDKAKKEREETAAWRDETNEIISSNERLIEDAKKSLEDAEAEWAEVRDDNRRLRGSVKKLWTIIDKLRQQLRGQGIRPTA